MFLDLGTFYADSWAPVPIVLQLADICHLRHFSSLNQWTIKIENPKQTALNEVYKKNAKANSEIMESLLI